MAAKLKTPIKKMGKPIPKPIKKQKPLKKGGK